MVAPAIQQQQQQQNKQSEPVSSAEEEALKWNTDCVYFLASPLTCKKGAECEYRHSEYARINPRDCYYWLSGNCMNPKCGFRHPPLEGLLGKQGGAPAGSVQQSHAPAHIGVAKQPVPCVFFQKGMCVKGDICSFLHTPNLPAYKKQHPSEAKPAADSQFSKKPIENYTGEKKFPNANLLMARSVEGYVPKTVGYEPVMEKQVMDHSTQLLHKYGSDDNNSFHNAKDTDDVLRESSPGFDVLVDNEARDSEYYHVEDRYGRRSQEGGNSVKEYDPDFSGLADGDKESFRDQRFDPYDHREDRYAWEHNLQVSSERGEPLEENILASDLRYRLRKQRKVNGMRHDYAVLDSSVEIGYRETRRDTQRESSISSSRLQGRIKLRENETHFFDRRTERGRERNGSSRLRDRGFRAPWESRREMEDERKPRTMAETKNIKEESKTEPPSLRKRKSSEEDHHHHHHHRHKQSRDSFAAPLPFSEILKRKKAAASGGNSNNKEKTPQGTTIKEEVEDEAKLITEVVSEPKAEGEEGTIMGEEEQVYEGNEEEQAYEGDDVNGEYYYEEGYEEGEEYNYEEGENAEGDEIVEEGEEEETTEAVEEEDIEKKTVEMLS